MIQPNRTKTLLVPPTCIRRVPYSEHPYTICLDGEGSKTALQVLDQEGHQILLHRNNISAKSVETTGSNINTIGLKGIQTVLKNLFDDVRVQQRDEKRLIDLLPYCQVIAGMAGAKDPRNKAAITSLFVEWGVPLDKICIMSDAECALGLFEGRGVILIGGTGSVCLGKTDSRSWQVGGLGKVLGDEGSAYNIGIQALRAAMADECGWGAPAALTQALRDFFKAHELRTLIPKIQRGEMGPSVVASCAPLVFKLAHENDAIAITIIDQAAKDLGFLLGTLVKISALSDCEVHLWGGLFTSSYADEFTQKVMHSAMCIVGDNRRLQTVNKSRENVAVQYALLHCKNHPR
jgi:N-acetylglucosamine kinase-like BadF-type ATPase